MSVSANPAGVVLLVVVFGVPLFLLVVRPVANRTLVPWLLVRYGAPPTPLLRLLRVPVLGAFLHALLPKKLAGESLPLAVRLLRYGLALQALLIVMFAVGLIGYGLYTSLVTPTDPVTGKHEVHILDLFTNPVLMFLTLGLPAVLFTLYDWRRRMGRPLGDLGVSFDRKAARGLAIGLVIGAGLVSLQLLAGDLGGIRYRGVPSGHRAPLLGVVTLLVTVAIWEELTFRGYILQTLRMQYKPRTAVIASSLLFALVHGQYLAFGWYSVLAVIGLFSFAAILAIGRLVSGTLALSIAIHFLWNAAGWAFGHMDEGLFKIPSPWLKADWYSASKILVGTPGSGGILDALIPVCLLWFVWRRYRNDPRMISAFPSRLWSGEPPSPAPVSPEADAARS
jgi:hypothetical protein